VAMHDIVRAMLAQQLYKSKGQGPGALRVTTEKQPAAMGLDFPHHLRGLGLVYEKIQLILGAQAPHDIEQPDTNTTTGYNPHHLENADFFQSCLWRLVIQVIP
jgi:hypothetical protein